MNIVVCCKQVIDPEAPPATGFEPVLALDCGDDGLDQIRRLWAQLTQPTGSGQAGKLRPGGHALLEVGSGQAEAVAALLKTGFPQAKVGIAPDLAGRGRVVEMAQ